jgi:hypothetical protein
LWWIGAGTVAAAVLPTIALDAPHLVFTASVSQVHSICGSALGGFAEALDAKARTGCTEGNAVYDVLTYVRILGLIAGAVALAAVWLRARDEVMQPEGGS